MRLKVYRGTPRHSEYALCNSCSHSRIIKGERLDDQRTYCNHFAEEIEVPFKVLECNQWSEKNKANIQDMAKMAWVIAPKKGDKPGFVSPKERKEYGVKVGSLTHGDTTYHIHGDDD